MWNSWTPWNTCSTTCGTGERKRHRTKSQEAHDGGMECVGNATETIKCHGGPCEGSNIWYPKYQEGLYNTKVRKLLMCWNFPLPFLVCNYQRLEKVAIDEGIPVAEGIFYDNDQRACEELCDLKSGDGCKSFRFCPGADQISGKCYLYQKQLSGYEPVTLLNYPSCYTSYRYCEKGKLKLLAYYEIKLSRYYSSYMSIKINIIHNFYQT